MFVNAQKKRLINVGYRVATLYMTIDKLIEYNKEDVFLKR